MSQTSAYSPAYISTQVQEARRFYLGTGSARAGALVAICGGWERTTRDYLISRNTFPWLAVEFVAGGRGLLTIRGRTYELSRGSLFTYGPGVPHRIESDRQFLLSKYYVDFGGRQAANLLAAAAMSPGSYRIASNAAELESAIDVLIAEGGASRPQTTAIASLQLHILLLKLRTDGVMDFGSERRGKLTLAHCLAHIDRHFLTLRSAEELAAACHVSPGHMSRLFRRFGYSPPYEHLVHKKMVHAAELLDAGELLVREVAETIGMDPFQFSRVFKRVHGLSPARFARRHGLYRRCRQEHNTDSGRTMD